MALPSNDSRARCIERFAFSGGDKLVTFLCVSVADNGQGIDEDAVSEIFTPFYTTKGERGTDLGLPQVCAFMRLVGGHIRVTSNLGKGTRFELFSRRSNWSRLAEGQEIA
jgi:signal transduction histidine kinase